MPNNGKGEKAMLKRAKLIVTVVEKAIAFTEFFFTATTILSFAVAVIVLMIVSQSHDIRLLNELVGFDLTSFIFPLVGAFFISAVITFLLSMILGKKALDRLFFRLAFSFAGTKEVESGEMRRICENRILEVFAEQAKRIQEKIAERTEFEKGKTTNPNLKASFTRQKRVYRAVEKEIALFREARTLVQTLCPWMKNAIERTRWGDYLPNAN